MSELSETRYEDRTDSVEKKLGLLQAAYEAGNHDLTMSLMESIKDTVRFERQRHTGVAEPLSKAADCGEVAGLPAAWAQWARAGGITRWWS